jgi:hypothetical protein
VIEKVQRLVDETPVDTDEAEAAPPKADITLEAPALPFPNFELLMATGMDKFAGQTANAGVPPLFSNSSYAHKFSTAN